MSRSSATLKRNKELIDKNVNNAVTKQLLKLYGSGLMEINNLITITTDAPENAVYQYCHSCYSNSCSYRGELHHLPWSTITVPVTETKPSQDAFHKGSSTWKLSGNGCFTFQKKSLHLDISLVSSQTTEHIKLILVLKSCPQGASIQFDEIKQCSVTLHVMNKENSVVHSKYVRISVSQAKSWKDLKITDDDFCTADEFRNQKMCQVSLKSISESETLDYEFSSLRVEFAMEMQPREGCAKSLTSTTCSGIQQEQINISLKCATKNSKPAVEHTYNSEKSLESVCSRFSSKFTDLVTIKVGSELQFSFPVHKHIIAEKSPVFETMFEAEMLEKKSGELHLPDVSPEIMEAFLSILYGTKDADRILEDVKLLVGILQLAHKYQMDNLVKQLLQILIPFSDQSMRMQDALQIYACGFKLHIPDLQTRALQWFEENKEHGTEEETKDALFEFIEIEKSATVSLLMRFQTGFCPIK